MCCFASVASFQARFGVGPSGLSGLSVFIALFTLLLASFLLAVPVVYDKYDKLHKVARALREIRVGFIANGAGAILVFLAAFATTISAWTQSGCKDASTDPSAKQAGKEFVAELPDWCRTKKAGAMFFWFSLIAWLAAVGLTFQEWRTGKRIYRPQDTPFVRPAEPPAHDEDDDEPFSPPSRRQTEDDSYDNRPPVASPFADSNRYTGAAGRPSMDAYGAFDDPTPSGYDQPYQPPVSRTMQIADPYAAVKASIHQGNNVSPNPPILPPLPSYNDTGYSGYRS